MLKNVLLFFVFLSLTFTTKAQHICFDAYQAFNTACPFDSTVNIVKLENWTIYQTLDNTWNGTIDSSVCISIDPLDSIGFPTIDWTNLQSGRPIFFRYEFTSANQVNLWANELWRTYAYFDVTDTTVIDYSTTNGMASGLRVHISIPDSTYTGRTERIYTKPFQTVSPMNYFVSSDIGGSFCLPTDPGHLQPSHISEFILKITPVDDFANETLEIATNGLDHEYPNAIYDSFNIYHNGTRYIHNTAYYWPGNNLVLYSDTTYPSAQTISYVTLNPYPQTSQQDTLHFYVDSKTHLTFQAFTQFIPGFVQGSTTQRHILNLVNNGGEMCLSEVLEVRVENNQILTYKSGVFDFQGQNSCIMVGNGGKLVIDDNAKLNYGETGEGILAFRSGGEIEFGKNAELHINNTMHIFDYGRTLPEDEIYITLRKGNKLTFGSKAKLYNFQSTDHWMRLNVYMKGGVLDDSNLTPEERALINRIYDEPAPVWKDNINLYPNPAHQQITYSYVAEKEGNLTTTIFSINGQVISTENHQLQKGINYFDKNIEKLETGNYIVQFAAEGKTFSKKLVVVE